MTWSFRWTYAGLWLVRVCLAFCGTGYIHPDEYMQNGEVTAGNILGLHALTTWEWRPDFPVRSILPTYLTTGFPLAVLRLLFGPEQLARKVHPSLVFRVERVAFLCLSAVLDGSILNLVSSPASPRLCLLLLVSSYVTCTFQIRPFSNSLESVLVALCLVLLRRIVDERMHLEVGKEKVNDWRPRPARTLKRDLHFLAVLAVIGIFTRPTFAAFAAPIAYQLLRFCYRETGSLVRTMSLLLPPFCTALAAASVFIIADTYYFCGGFSRPVVTPYNFVKYNFSTENLADHGLHPRWLHVGVNLPMLLGPLLVWLLWCSAYEFIKHPRREVRVGTDILRQTLIQIVVLSLSVLSVQPHQEPRFLTPLVLPIIVLAATAESRRPGKFFWAAWIIFNMVLAIVFGCLHQGGVVPSLLSLHSTLRNASAGSSIRVVYWGTYMPPRHLLGIPRQAVTSGEISVVDLAGAPQDDLVTTLSVPSFNRTYLVSPVSMCLTLPRHVSSCMTLQERIFPHLDLDHIPESVKVGWYDGLSLGIYAIASSCVGDSASTRSSAVTEVTTSLRTTEKERSNSDLAPSPTIVVKR